MRARSRCRLLRVYPRAGGGTGTEEFNRVAVQGLSPRRRGNRVATRELQALVGSIPAQAGEPLSRLPRPARSRVYPRAGGGTGDGPAACRLHEGLSPRRRGNPELIEPAPAANGSIPAQAGEPVQPSFQPLTTGVYPRAGGGTSISSSGLRSIAGLSPRRRGNPRRRRSSTRRIGSIPAQAGEPPPPPRTA